MSQDPALPWSLRQYLEAFDRYLAAGSETGQQNDNPEADEARRQMDEHLARARRSHVPTLLARPSLERTR